MRIAIIEENGGLFHDLRGDERVVVVVVDVLTDVDPRYESAVFVKNVLARK